MAPGISDPHISTSNHATNGHGSLEPSASVHTNECSLRHPQAKFARLRNKPPSQCRNLASCMISCKYAGRLKTDDRARSRDEPPRSLIGGRINTAAPRGPKGSKPFRFPFAYLSSPILRFRIFVVQTTPAAHDRDSSSRLFGKLMPRQYWEHDPL